MLAPLGRLFAAAFALVVLNQALVFRNVWPTPWITPGTAVTVELWVLLLGAAWLTRGPRRLSRRALHWVAIGYTALIMGRYAMVTAPALYGRPIDLYWEAQHLPNVVAMLLTTMPPWLALLALVAPVALLGLLYLATKIAWRAVGAALAKPVTRPALVLAGVTLVGWFVAGQFYAPLATERWFAHRVSPLYFHQAAVLFGTWTGLAEARRLPEPPALASNLGRVREADVLLVFLESYGATGYDNPRHAAALASARAALNDAIAASGGDVVSARIGSTTFGGGSWLAHSSWLAGTPITGAATYGILLKTERPTWVTLFAAQGYRTLALMPGTRGPWPEGRFYGFDRIYDAAALDYRGPAFGWWRIPDQYSWARFEAVELDGPRTQPRFVFFPTITSHMPFKPTPPLQPDRARLLGTEPFPADQVSAALAESAAWTDFGAAYTDAIDYSLRMLAELLQREAARERVVILLGDHQPPALVSGDGADWTVPIHVISRRPELLAALRTAGFTPGLGLPDQTLAPLPEASLLVLKALATPATPAPDSAPRHHDGVDR